MSASDNTTAKPVVERGPEPPLPVSEVPAPKSRVVRVRGIPYSTRICDLRTFFLGYALSTDPNPVVLCLYKNESAPLDDSEEANGNTPTNEAFVMFQREDDVMKAVERLNRNRLGIYTLELCVVSEEEKTEAIKAHEQFSKERDSALVLRLRGLPYSSTKQDIYDFLPTVKSIVRVDLCVDQEGNLTGDAFVELKDPDDVKETKSYHERTMGNRYIEVLDCTAHERECILAAASRRSRQRYPRGAARPSRGRPAYPAYSPYDFTAYGGGYAPFPYDGSRGGPWSVGAGVGAPMNPLYQRLDAVPYGGGFPPFYDPPPYPTAASSVDGPYVVRLRGLPVSFDESQIAKFLGGEVHIAPHGVHLVLCEDNSPSGEAFVELESYDSVDRALRRHHTPLQEGMVEVYPSSIQEMQVGQEVPPPPPPGAMNGYSY